MTKQTKVILIVAIAGACCVGVILILILAAIAIPATQSVIRKGNEASAIASLRTINTAEQQYNFTYPERGYSCSLSALGGSAQNIAATADAAQLIQPDLASGHKNGYSFAILDCVKEKGTVTSYMLTAVPDVVGHSGAYGICMNGNGEARIDPKGGADCTEALQ